MRSLVALCTLVAALGAAGPAAADRAARVPPFPNLPGTWSHAEINVRIGRQPHTLILDRGMLTKIAHSSLQVRESDGSTRTIRVSGRTIVADETGRIPLSYLRTGSIVETMRIDGGTAVRVRIL